MRMMPESIEHLVHAPDGWRLSVLEFRPRGPARGMVVAGAAMMVDRKTLCRADRPTVASVLVRSGFRVLVPDLRGHGASGPTARRGGDWSYDDLVRDTEVYIDLARSLDDRLPLALVGHSLFGHTSLAYLGLEPEAPVDGVVGFAINLWNRRWAGSFAGWLAQLAIVGAGEALNRTFGYLPSGRLGFGTADEAPGYWHTFFDWVAHDRWTSRDGVDYHAALSRVRCPVLHVVSEGDGLYARPDEALNFSAPLGPRREVLRLGPGCPHPELRGLRPGHMDMVTDPRNEPLWEHAAAWIRGVLQSGG